jgi:hydrogenase/urease accessory protein HupE
MVPSVGERARARLVSVAGAVVLLAAARPAHAHDEGVTSADLEIGERQIVCRLDVPVAALVRAGPLPTRAGALPSALPAAGEAVGRYLADALDVEAGGRRLEAELGVLAPRDGAVPVTRVVQTLTFRSPAPIEALRVSVRLFAEVTSSHQVLLRAHGAGGERQMVRRGPFEVALDARHLAPSAATVVRDFLGWGVHHIFVGYDHIAFLLALLLAVTRLRELLLVVTSFTVAHSVTLLLSGLGLLRIPSRLSEVLIAASIVYVAVENLRRAGKPLSGRWAVTFLFGLVHGLGFAAELQERLAEGGGGVLLPILSFNLGVEIGQVVIVALVYPVLVWMRRAPTAPERRLRQNRLLRMGSVPILLLGIFWLLDRALA